MMYNQNPLSPDTMGLPTHPHYLIIIILSDISSVAIVIDHSLIVIMLLPCERKQSIKDL